ncbi:hypothetical protein PYCC9005_005595 [Savitreella phatthalungensis]
MTTSRFTIAKLDAGMAILLTSDHHLIEFPSLLLPQGVRTGSIIDLDVAQNKIEEDKVASAFVSLQKEIRSLFAVHTPSTPELCVRNITQTSIVLEWKLLDLATANFRSLALYKNGTKLGKIPNATTTVTKLSGLSLDTAYTFQLVLRTSAGTYKSNVLEIRTHKMTELTGLNVCLAGHLSTNDRDRVTAALDRIGAKPPHDKIRIDTTHFVASSPQGDEHRKAQQTNVPIVVADFVEACESEGRIVRVGLYYLDSDPSLRPRPASRQPTISGAAPPAASTVTAEAASAGEVRAAASVPVPQTPAAEAPNPVDETEGPPRRSAGTQPASAQTRRTVSEADESPKSPLRSGSEGYNKLAGYLEGKDEEPSLPELAPKPVEKEVAAPEEIAQTASSSADPADAPPVQADDEVKAEVAKAEEPAAVPNQEAATEPGPAVSSSSPAPKLDTPADPPAEPSVPAVAETEAEVSSDSVASKPKAKGKRKNKGKGKAKEDEAVAEDAASETFDNVAL